MSFLKKLHPCPQIPLSPLKPPASWTTCHAEDDTTQTQQGEQNESHLEGGIRIPRWGRGRQIRKRSRFVTWKHELLHLRFTCRLIIIYIHIFLAHVSAISIYIYSYTCLYPCILVKNWGNSWHGIFLLQNSNLPLVKSPFPSETSSPATETSSISWAPIVHLWRWKIFFVESSRYIS